MKKILLILLFVLPSVLVLADGPQYKFLRGSANKRVSSLREAYDVHINRGARNVQGSGVSDYSNVNGVVAPLGRSIVSSDITIKTEEDSRIKVSAGSIVGGRTSSNDGFTNAHGSNSTVGFENGDEDGITLGLVGNLAGKGNAVQAAFSGTIGTGQPPMLANPTVPLGDALLPLLMMILSFAGFVYFRKK